MNRIKAVIRLGATNGSVTERGGLPIQKVSYLGKSSNSVPLFPYGMHARPKPGWLSLIFSYGARSENRWHMVSSAERRPTDLADGEIVFYHPPTMAEIRLKSDGTIEATTSLFKVIGDFQVTGDALINGDEVVEGGLNVIGESSMDSNLTVLGDTALTSTVTSNGKDISDTSTHTVGSYTQTDPSQLITGTSGTVS